METEQPLSFGEVLRRHRTIAGLTQEELAERAGLSAQAVSTIERGVKKWPRPDTVRLLAQALDLSGDERARFEAAVAPRRRGPARQGNMAQPSPRPAALPAPRTALIGREREVARVHALLQQPDVALVTLVGPGGVGKTRLAVEVASALGAEFGGGVYYVGLAPVQEPGLVAATLAQALGVTDRAGEQVEAGLRRTLADRDVLCVLDNFEAVAAAAPLLAELLAACPRLKLLVTSQTVLLVRGERVVRVAPLGLPAGVARRSAAQLAHYPAVHLFVERARALREDFAVTNDTIGDIVEVCRRLDGLPLAIELAAARLRHMPLTTLVERLEGRLALLTGGARDMPARQQTLRNTIDWSYDLLDAREQMLLQHLSIFVGGCTLEAAERVCRLPDDGHGASGDLLEHLSSLVDKSLVRQEEEEEGQPRFGLLETIREYALERQGGEEGPRERHAAYYVGLAQEAEPALVGPAQARWLARLAREHDNLRAALRWTLERGQPAAGLRAAAALTPFWLVRGYLREGRRWLEALLAAGAGAGPDAVAAAVQAKALRRAGLLAATQGDYGGADGFYAASLAGYTALGDTAGRAAVLNNRGIVAQEEGDLARAGAFFGQSLALRRAGGEPLDVAMSLNNLGEVARLQGEAEQARALYQEALALCEEERHIWGIGLALCNLGHVARAQGQLEGAARFYRRSLAQFRTVGDLHIVGTALEGLAAVAGEQGAYAEAARLYGAAVALREASGAPLPPSERAAYAAATALVRAALGDAEFAAAWDAGRGREPEWITTELLGAAPADSPGFRGTPRRASTPDQPGEAR